MNDRESRYLYDTSPFYAALGLIQSGCQKTRQISRYTVFS